MTTRRHGTRLYALALAATLVTALCLQSSSVAAGSRVAAGSTASSITVGGLCLLTGEFASFGQGTLQGLKAGIDQVNRAGGVNGHPLSLDVADATSDPVDAIAPAKKLVNIDHVVFEDCVAGPLADATVRIFTRAGVPFLTPGGDVNFDTNTDPYVWRLTPSDSQLGVAMALYARRHGYRKAALMFTNGSTAIGLGDVVRKTFRRLGGSIVSDLTLQPDLSSYNAEVSRTIASHPDVILIEMDANTSGVVFKELRSLKALNTPMIGTDEDVGTDFIKAVGASSARKVLVSMEGGTYQSPAAAVFTRAVKAISGQAPIANAEYTYDGVVIAALAMVAAHGITSQAVNAGIMRVTAAGGTPVYSYSQGLKLLRAGKRITYIGASGPFYYNAHHNVFGPFIAVKLNPDGQTYATVTTLTPEELKKATG